MKPIFLKALWLLFFGCVLAGTVLVTTYESPITIKDLQDQR